MSDEKRKPFADVFRSGDGWSALIVADERTPGVAVTEVAEAMAARINAAVEAREAKLVELLRAVVHLDATASGNTEPWPSFARLAASCRAALGASLVPVVPKSQLDKAEATIKKMRAAFEALDPREHANGELVAEWLRVNGLVAPKKPEQWTEIELTEHWVTAENERIRRVCVSSRPHGYVAQWRKAGDPVPVVDACMCGLPREATIHGGY